MEELTKATFAGGCFWCMVKPFDELPGILSITSGYTGGHKPNPTYEEVCAGKTGHIEAVQIEYAPELMSYTQLLDIFFRSIDPTDGGGQFGDRGESYKPVIFYSNDAQRQDAENFILRIDQSGVYSSPVAVELRRASEFYPAEEYHQDYYKKNPKRYKQYYKGSGREKYLRDQAKMLLPPDDVLKTRLSALQYAVTRENATEPPFSNTYDRHFEDGIYVDIISGKPLFSSKDKFDSGCGWPAFSKPLNPGAIVTKTDLSHGMLRTEVRSSYADSHLGHVFDDGPSALGGQRYCINSASLQFVPKSEMEAKGYGPYLKYV